MNRETAKAIVRLSKIMSTDTYRPSICAVVWDKDIIKATNGHTGSIQRIEESTHDAQSFGSEEISILKVLLKDKKKTDFAVFGKAPDGYPDLESVLRVTQQGGFSVCLNADLLATLSEALNDSTMSKGVVLTFDTKNKLSPIVCTVGTNSGVIMPMRF